MSEQGSIGSLPQGQQTMEDRKWIKRALGIDILIVLLTWILLKIGTQGDNLINVKDVVVLGTSLMLIPIITFGGFYLASPAAATSRDPWMRNAIAAAFVVFYLFLLSLLLIVPHVRGSVAADNFGQQIFTGFTTFLGVVLGFYFLAQAAERVAETIQSGQTTRVAIENQPSLAQRVIREQEIASRKGGPQF